MSPFWRHDNVIITLCLQWDITDPLGGEANDIWRFYAQRANSAKLRYFLRSVLNHITKANTNLWNQACYIVLVLDGVTCW